MTDEKFVSPEPPPTPYEAELLVCLIEECAEVQQRATKALRFGVNEVQPGQALSNSERMSEELGDLLCVVTRLKEVGLVRQQVVDAAYGRKNVKLNRYLQHRPDGEPA